MQISCCAEAKFNMSFKDRKPFLKDFATTYLKNTIEDKTEAPEEAAAVAEEQTEEPREEAAKAVETEADMAAKQPQEEAAAGEPAAGGAVAAPVDRAAEDPEPKAVAPAAEVGTPSYCGKLVLSRASVSKGLLGGPRNGCKLTFM